MSLEIEATEYVDCDEQAAVHDVSVCCCFRPRPACPTTDVHHVCYACSLHSVIKVILQFCKENGLTESFNALQVSVTFSPLAHP
jgi:hypothetical protein